MNLPRGLLLGNCSQLIQNKTKQKQCAVTHENFEFAKELLRVPNNCSQKVSQYVAVCVVNSSVLALIYSVYTDKALAWLSFRKIYVPNASFSKNVLQITGINFQASNYNLAQWILRRILPPSISLADFEMQIFLRM